MLDTNKTYFFFDVTRGNSYKEDKVFEEKIEI